MSMTLEEVEARMPAWYMSSVQDGGPSYHIESAPGRGKTATFKRFPEIMSRIDPEGNYGFVLIPGESCTLSELCGFQQLLNATHKDQLLRSVFSLPHWWFTRTGEALGEFDGVMVFVDEYDKMDHEPKKMVAAMRLDKRIANHWLPQGTVVWTAGNRKNDRSGYTKDYDFAINRTIKIEVRDSSESWVKWCHANSVLPEIIAFGETFPHILFMDAPTIQGPWCTPRSLVQVDTHLRSLMKTYKLKKIPLDMLAQTEVAGGIGKEAAEQLFLHIRLGQELPSYEDVVATPESIKIPNQPDQMRLFVYKIADKAKPQHAEAIGKWLVRFPNEFQIMFARMVGRRNPLVIAQPSFREWFRQNAALIALIDQFQQRQAA